MISVRRSGIFSDHRTPRPLNPFVVSNTHLLPPAPVREVRRSRSRAIEKLAGSLERPRGREARGRREEDTGYKKDMGGTEGGGASEVFPDEMARGRNIACPAARKVLTKGRVEWRRLDRRSPFSTANPGPPFPAPSSLNLACPRRAVPVGL